MTATRLPNDVLTADKLEALKALAARKGFGCRYLPKTSGEYQIGFGENGNPACEIVYTSWMKPGRRLQVRQSKNAAMVELAAVVREICEL